MSLTAYNTRVNGYDVTYCEIEGTTYYLYTGEVTLKTGKDTMIYVFFPKNRVDSGSISSNYKPTTLPSGWRIEQTESSKMPVVRK